MWTLRHNLFVEFGHDSVETAMFGDSSCSTTKDFGHQEVVLTEVAKLDVASLTFWKAPVNAPSIFEQRYELIKRSVYRPLHDFETVQLSLWCHFKTLLCLSRKTQSVTTRLTKPLKLLRKSMRSLDELLAL